MNQHWRPALLPRRRTVRRPGQRTRRRTRTCRAASTHLPARRRARMHRRRPACRAGALPTDSSRAVGSVQSTCRQRGRTTLQRLTRPAIMRGIAVALRSAFWCTMCGTAASGMAEPHSKVGLVMAEREAGRRNAKLCISMRLYTKSTNLLYITTSTPTPPPSSPPPSTTTHTTTTHTPTRTACVQS